MTQPKPTFPFNNVWDPKEFEGSPICRPIMFGKKSNLCGCAIALLHRNLATLIVVRGCVAHMVEHRREAPKKTVQVGS